MKSLELVLDEQARPPRIDQPEIKRRLVAAMPDAQVALYDLTGDGNHYQLEVKSSAFAGKTRLEQHRLVNAIFADVLGGSLHALALKTSPL